MTEVELFRQPARQAALAQRADIDSWVLVASDVIKLAEYICETEFVPRAYRNKPHAVAAAILAGRELDLPPMTSLRHVQVVEGSPSLSAEYKRARVLAAGHDFDVLEINTIRCRVSGRRKDRPGSVPLEITFTIDDAKRAGIFKARGAWETRPRRMLFARAGTELCDFLFPDVTNGLPTTELVTEAAEDDGFGGYSESPGQAPPATAGERPAPRTAQRRSRAATAIDAAKPDERTPVAPANAVPLPGEDDEAETDEADGGDTMHDDSHKDEPGSVTKEQLTKLGTVFTHLGFKASERDQRLQASSQIVNRQLSSASDLSLNEARALIDTLESLGTREKLVELLAVGARDRADAGTQEETADDE